MFATALPVSVTETFRIIGLQSQDLAKIQRLIAPCVWSTTFCQFSPLSPVSAASLHFICFPGLLRVGQQWLLSSSAAFCSWTRECDSSNSSLASSRGLSSRQEYRTLSFSLASALETRIRCKQILGAVRRRSICYLRRPFAVPQQLSSCLSLSRASRRKRLHCLSGTSKAFVASSSIAVATAATTLARKAPAFASSPILKSR